MKEANIITDPTKTRKDAVIIEANSPAEMIGYYLADDLTKTWKEDFSDATTGEIVTIERCEVIESRGTLITPEKAATINFFIQAGDVQLPIKVSDQRRQAAEYNDTHLKPYKVIARINSKPHTFILEAQTVELATEVARDYIELNYKGHFTIVSVSSLKNVVLLNTTLQQFNDQGEGQEVSGDGAADGESTRYYKAAAEVTVSYTDIEYPEKIDFTFIVKTLDVDTAKAAASAWIASRMKKPGEQRTDGREIKALQTTLTAAVPFACTTLINHSFCEAYRVLND